jgi:DNA-binding protein HU-beta
MLNKEEFTSLYAKIAGKTNAEAKKDVNAFIDAVDNAILEHDGVQFVGAFTISVKAREAHKGRNPQTGKEIDIPAKKSVKIKAGKFLNNALNA